jgi:hypothetical protein
MVASMELCELSILFGPLAQPDDRAIFAPVEVTAGLACPIQATNV